MKNDRKNLPLVSIIIVNYNGVFNLGSLLDKCIESVLNTDYEKFEVIFVDNASRDNSAMYIKRRFGEKLKILALDKNYGYAGGVNKGIKIAEGNALAILNSDVVVEKEWLSNLIQGLLHDKNAKIAHPKVLMMENPKRIASCGGAVNVLLVAWDRHLLENDSEPKHMDHNSFHPPGAAFVVNRELVNEFGGSLYDDEYFAYFEDVDLGWRCHLLGYDVVFVPQSVVYHKLGGSFGMVSPLKFYLMRRNALHSGIKNMEVCVVLVLLPVWLVASFYASYLFFKATRNPLYVRMGLKVIFGTILNFKKVWKKRFLVNAKRYKSTRELPFSNLLLTYKPSVFAAALVKLVNKILELVNLRDLSINEMKEYPTFQLMAEEHGY